MFLFRIEWHSSHNTGLPHVQGGEENIMCGRQQQQQQQQGRP